MDGISWANAIMFVASIPSTDAEDKEEEIDLDNIGQYLNKI